MTPNGSHNDRRRRRWAARYVPAPAELPQKRLAWWRRLLSRVSRWREQMATPSDRMPLPRPVYGRGGQR